MPDPTTLTRSTATSCCGQGGTHAPKTGDPIATSCKLCPRSPTYWRWEGRTDEQGPVLGVTRLG